MQLQEASTSLCAVLQHGENTYSCPRARFHLVFLDRGLLFEHSFDKETSETYLHLKLSHKGPTAVWKVMINSVRQLCNSLLACKWANRIIAPQTTVW